VNISKIVMSIAILILVGCGSASSGESENSSIDEVPMLDKNTSFRHSAKTVTIYVHGYKKGGFEWSQNYGENYDSEFSNRVAEFTSYPKLDEYNKDDFTDVITAVEYYGDNAPDYYSQKDIEEIEDVTAQYGGGIPRYALIVAKFAKHMLQETEAERVNIVSVSMGSFITRWMIEKNLENLASDKKIEKWMSAEGVIRGNYGYTKIGSLAIDIQAFIEDSAETRQMKYSWIEENLTPDRAVMKSPYYSDILVGQISLTDSEKEQAGLKYILIEEGFQPNDGYQLVKDTYFGEIENSIQAPSHTFIHTDHISIEKSDATFLTIANFLEAKKRVRITLVDATVSDLHESITTLNKDTETVFESDISANDKKICERVYNGGTLIVHDYTKENQTKEINQIIFDDFVSPTESTLVVRIKGYEIDRSTKYSVSEWKTDKKESMGESINNIELKEGIYPISAKDWSGNLKVEILEM